MRIRVGVGIFAIPYIALTLYLTFKAFVSSLPHKMADDIDGHLPDAPDICNCSYFAPKLSILYDKIGNLKFTKSKSTSQESLLADSHNGSYSISNNED